MPIGKPFGNTRIYIVDRETSLCPDGVIGELLIGGTGVSKGYLNREEQTAQRFIADNFSGLDGARLYRTGDLVRRLWDGNIEFIGRVDDQVKIRGYRVELGEIAAALQKHETVNQCVVTVIANEPGEKQLVAYVVATADFTWEGVKQDFSASLPAYMVPGIAVRLPELPLNANGKIDRKALPAPETLEAEAKSYVPPRSDTEMRLVQIWEDRLKVEGIGIRDNFFELGGHSLLATRVVSAIRKQLSTEIAIKDIFIHPTVEALAALIDGESMPENLAGLEVQERPQRIPVSFSQERLWFVDPI